MKVRVALGVVAAGALLAASARADTVQAPVTATAYAVRLNPPAGAYTGSCRVFPTDNAWNMNVRNAPLRARSNETIAYIQAHGADFLHPDFGENQTYGLPYVVVPQSQPLVPISYDAYGDESDPGPFPIPLNAPIEAGSDQHVLVVREGTCDLFELYRARRTTNGWVAESGARFDLTSNALRPLGWTSADAAGLPITPGLVRYEEVAAGHIDHAIRVTFDTTQRGFILPATHLASSTTNIDAPPMGLRLRLKASYDITRLTGQARVIAEAMQNYGLIVADNGSNWFFQGAPSPYWNDDELNQLKGVPGTAFEVVDTGPVLTG
ncbi:MAG: hypothetical protein Q7T27_06405 [Pseudomonas sp.]|uniref:hypothetical protein n=1 Tax=Pseudomonas sp. TaxID=306 RepID=UPI0027286414|nr:hypothetical protein [Pseudomonas sp.]MDO8403110.1 hypothetical protein [Pseudomonas sp.]